MKTCSKCGLTKPFDDFNLNKSKSDGYQTSCKSCKKDYNRRHYQVNKKTYVDRSLKWKLDNPIKILAHRYGVSEVEINTLITEYPSCGMCGSEIDLVVDHCHESGELRGRLCGRCNKTLGLLGDNLESAERFLDSVRHYLSKKTVGVS